MKFLHSLARSLSLCLGVVIVAPFAIGQTAAAPVEPQPRDAKLPTLWIAGDSTAAKAPATAGHQGWGEPFPSYFDPAKINVVNRARGGRSSRTFITEGLWDDLIAGVKAGNFVLIQFGHNDSGATNAEPPGSTKPLRARGSLPGLGEETEEIDNVLTKKHEVVHTFGWYIRKMIADVRAKGGKPIVLSLTVRNYWKDGKVERGSGEYRQWDHALADAAGVPFLDLTRIVADEYQELGEEKVKALFSADHVHTNEAGAETNAAAVVAGLKGLRNVFPKDLFSAKGLAVEPDQIGWLNLPEPAKPALPTIMLIGDSTVRNGRDDGAGGQWGWGDSLADHVDLSKVNVVNRAVGGTSTRSFVAVGYWRRVKTLLKPGDFLLMQFGHNDDKKDDRASLKGAGDETKELVNPKTGKPETVHTYGWYLRQYIREAKAMGVTPIVCSSVPRKIWKDGKVEPGALAGYTNWAHEIAEQEKVGFVDLNALISRRYETLGQAKVDALFADEHTHTTLTGAKLNAEIVAEALKQMPGDPLHAYFR